MNVFNAGISVNYFVDEISSIFFHDLSFLVHNGNFSKKFRFIQGHKNIVNSFFNINFFFLALEFWPIVNNILKNGLNGHLRFLFHQIERLISELFQKIVLSLLFSVSIEQNLLPKWVSKLPEFKLLNKNICHSKFNFLSFISGLKFTDNFGFVCHSCFSF